MKFYHEITVIPNPEIGEHFIWSKLFTQIHLALVSIQDEQKKSPVGISFPEYFMGEKFGVIGSKLRLFAQSEPELQKLDIQKHLSRLTDYIHISSIREVPQKISGYSTYNRHQPKVNKERLARRRSVRHKIDYATALEHFANMKHKAINLPYIKLKSLSSQEPICLWIKKIEKEPSQEKVYSTYGLSSSSTVPEF